MRCNNCWYYPMKEDENDCMKLVCPNCGYIHLEGCNEHFIRTIYENIEDAPFDENDHFPSSVDGLQSEIREREPLTKEQVRVMVRVQDVMDDIFKK